MNVTFSVKVSSKLVSTLSPPWQTTCILTLPVSERYKTAESSHLDEEHRSGTLSELYALQYHERYPVHSVPCLILPVQHERGAALVWAEADHRKLVIRCPAV